MTFVDTNYFLRFLLADQPTQTQVVAELFLAGAQGQKKLATSIIVFFEVYWVLKSLYGKEKTTLIATLKGLSELNFIFLAESKRLETALTIFEETNLSLPDAYNLGLALEENMTELATFDVALLKQFTLRAQSSHSRQ